MGINSFIIRLEDAVSYCEKALDNWRGFVHTFFSKDAAMCLLADILILSFSFSSFPFPSFFCFLLSLIYFTYSYQARKHETRRGSLQRGFANSTRHR